MKAVDLFCGAGGFSLGAHQAGIEVISAYDIDPILTSSFKYNFPNTTLKLLDLRNLSGVDLIDHAGGSVDFIFGGPPCQGFSMIGKRDNSDPRRELLNHFFRIVGEAQPNYFVMENVLGLTQGSAREALNAALDLVISEYDVCGPLVLDAADFGAATSRKRLFVIGRKKSSSAVFNPKFPSKPPPATVADAISDLSSATKIGISDDGYDTWQLAPSSHISAYAENLRAKNLLITGNLRTKHTDPVTKRFANIRQGEVDKVGRHPRLAWDGLCPTLRAGTGSDRGSFQAVRPIHPSEPRVITVREAARLQGFPDCHKFHPTIWHSFRMIGNSVSPFVSNAIFCALIEDSEKPAQKQLMPRQV